MSTPADNRTSTSPAPPVPSWELRGHAFRWVLPPGWTDRSVYCFSGTPEGDVHPTLTVTTEAVASGVELAAYAADQLDQLAGQLPEFELVRSESRMLGTRPCRWAQFRWKHADSGLMKQSQWYLIQGSRALTLTATATDAQYGQFEATFEQAIKAFTPLA